MKVIVINSRSQFYLLSGIVVNDFGEGAKIQFKSESKPVFFYKSELGQVVGHSNSKEI